jgi:Domain of unknown function (DUF4262)
MASIRAKREPLSEGQDFNPAVKPTSRKRLQPPRECRAIRFPHTMNDPKPFQTERTQFLQTCKLDKSEQRAVDNIEAFGCHIIQVNGDSAGAGWSYTLGINDTCNQPELIVVGLKNDGAAMHLLNEAARQLRKGVDITAAPQDDMLGNVQCIFRPVDPKWVQHLMGWAKWFQCSWDFPLLQAIYPDLENRFQGIDGQPGDPDFTEYFRQPLLQPGAAMTRTENDFWAAADPENSLFDWTFHSLHIRESFSRNRFSRTMNR